MHYTTSAELQARRLMRSMRGPTLVVEARAGADWTQLQAIHFAGVMQTAVAGAGWLIALGGGCLHKSGARPDVDLVAFRHSNSPDAAVAMLLECVSPYLDCIEERSWGFTATSLIISPGRVDFNLLERPPAMDRRISVGLGLKDTARPASGGEAEVRRDAYGMAWTPSDCGAIDCVNGCDGDYPAGACPNIGTPS